MEVYGHKHVKKDTLDFAQHMFNVLWVELARDDPMNEEMQSAGVGETFAVPDQVALVAGQQALEASLRLLEGRIRLSVKVRT
jgi:hypothetical protein